MASPSQYAAAVLRGIGAPVTPRTIAGFIGWSKAEGPLASSNWQRNNPLNTTESMGAVGGAFNSAGVRTYPTAQAGVAATVKTLKNGRYGPILNAFRSGNVGGLGAAIGQTPWGTSGQLASQTIADTLRQGGITVPAGGGGINAPQRQGTKTLNLGPIMGERVVPTFDQAGYRRAQAQYLLGQIVSQQGKNPWDIGPKGAVSSGPNPLIASGVATTQAPNVADFQGQKTQTYKVAQNTLQVLAGQTPLNSHGALTSGKGDFATPTPQKIVDMQNFAKTLIGAPYSQGNHAASFSQGVGLIKKYGTDCSGLVSLLLGHAGVIRQPYTTDTIMNDPSIQPGAGQHITIWNRPFAGNQSHMIVQIGKDWFESGGRFHGVVQMSPQDVRVELGGGGFRPIHPRGM